MRVLRIAFSATGLINRHDFGALGWPVKRPVRVTVENIEARGSNDLPQAWFLCDGYRSKSPHKKTAPESDAVFYWIVYPTSSNHDTHKTREGQYEVGNA